MAGDVVSESGSTATGKALALSFSGSGSEYIKKLIKGYLLLIPTLGFYRFWLTTNLRRHLWANTQIEGEPLEYTGTGKELLVGFLIAVAALLPVILAFYILPLALGALAFIPIALLTVGLLLLTHYAVFGARRYIATRTLFRGIRFWVEPAGWGYAFRALGWDFLTIITIGICLPWRIAALERYKMHFTQYGNLKGTFVATGGQLFRKLGVLYALVAVVVILAVISALSRSISGGALHGLIVVLYFALLLFTPYIVAVITRWHLSGIKFGNVSLRSDLGAGTMYGLWLKCFGSLFLFGLVTMLFMALAILIVSPTLGLFGILNAPNAQSSTAGTFGAFVVLMVFYLFFLGGMAVIARYFFHRGFWIAITKTLSVDNPEQLATATATGQAADKLGAGLADALGATVSF